MTREYVLQLAQAYAFHALCNCSDYSKEYWRNVFRELDKMRAEVRKGEHKQVKECNIIGAVSRAIEKLADEEFSHEVYILGESSVHVNFMIDGKEYVIALHEIEDGHVFSEYL